MAASQRRPSALKASRAYRQRRRPSMSRSCAGRRRRRARTPDSIDHGQRAAIGAESDLGRADSHAFESSRGASRRQIPDGWSTSPKPVQPVDRSGRPSDQRAGRGFDVRSMTVPWRQSQTVTRRRTGVLVRVQRVLDGSTESLAVSAEARRPSCRSHRAPAGRLQPSPSTSSTSTAVPSTPLDDGQRLAVRRSSSSASDASHGGGSANLKRSEPVAALPNGCDRAPASAVGADIQGRAPRRAGRLAGTSPCLEVVEHGRTRASSRRDHLPITAG